MDANKLIIVLDIDETLIASKDKHQKEIYKECLNDSVMECAKKLGTQYQEINISNLETAEYNDSLSYNNSIGI